VGKGALRAVPTNSLLKPEYAWWARWRFAHPTHPDPMMMVGSAARTPYIGA